MKKLFTMFALALAFFATGCTQIDTGNVGVESSLGQYKEAVLSPGMYGTFFKTVTEVNAHEIALSMNDLKPKSLEQITMSDFDVDIYYRINPAKASLILTKYTGDLTKDKGADLVGNNYMTRQARVAIYNVASTFKAAEMNQKRDKIEEAIRVNLQAELDKEVGKDWFTVGNVNVRNIVADVALEASITAAAKTQFEISRKSQETQLAREEAARLEVEATGIAKANRILGDSLTPQLIRLREIEAQKAFAGAGTHTVLLPQGGGGASVLIGK